MVEYHLGDRKGYRATICFGASSTTDDLEGELHATSGRRRRRRDVLEAALAGFTGPIRQVPPAYSAIKVAGRRAYAMARAGETVELASREVTIHALDLVSWDDADPDRPIAVVDVDVLGRDVRPGAGSRPRRATGECRLPGRLDPARVRAVRARRRGLDRRTVRAASRRTRRLLRSCVRSTPAWTPSLSWT